MPTYYVMPTGNDSNAGTSTGAAFATLGKALQVAVANDTILPQTGTYVSTSNSYNVSGGCFCPAVTGLRVQGWKTTPGEILTDPADWPEFNAGTTTPTGYFWDEDQGSAGASSMIQIHLNSNSRGLGVSRVSKNNGSSFLRCKLQGGAFVNFRPGRYVCCHLKTSGAGFLADRCLIETTGSLIGGGAALTVVANSVILLGSGHEIQQVDTINCVIRGASSGLGAGYLVTTNAAAISDGCHYEGLAYSIREFQSSRAVMLVDWSQYSITNPYTPSNSFSDGNVVPTSSPLTNPGSLDFSANNTASAGALLRGVARLIPGTATTTYRDRGAVQHLDSGGGAIRKGSIGGEDVY